MCKKCLTHGIFDFLSLQGCVLLSVVTRKSTQSCFCSNGYKSPSLTSWWSWVPRVEWHLDVLARCLLPKDTSFGQTQIPSLSELLLWSYTDWFPFTYFSRLRNLENKAKRKAYVFSKQTKLVSPLVCLVFQDKLSFPLHHSRSVRSPVINQNLAMDLAH